MKSLFRLSALALLSFAPHVCNAWGQCTPIVIDLGNNGINLGPAGVGVYFDVNAEYTEIPKVLKGYYKAVNGKVTENIERGKSENIRAGNVWLDIQQVFYRMEENVAGCYAQKPMKSIERIITASAALGVTVADFFSHSGTTLIAGERLGRRVIAADVDPIYAEITIRRLERFRKLGKIGWQWESPFPELGSVLAGGQGESRV